MKSTEYARLKELVESNLYKYLPEKVEESKTLLEAMRYSLEAGGKRIRPMMLLAACKMAGGDENKAIPFACAIEFIHTYSLIHDDLPAMDDDDLRRGKPTNHVVFGEAAAILAGDALLNRAFEIMLQTIIIADEADRMGMIKAAGCIASGAGYYGMVGGQVVDILGDGRDLDSADEDRTVDDIIDDNFELLKFIHRSKTGALIRSAVLAGAYIGGADEALTNDLREYSDLFGQEFQIADDILDVVGNVNEMGKPVGSDKKNGKLTYPSHLGMDKTLEIYHEVHKSALEKLKKYGNKAEFFINLSDELYERVK